jgi:hypothetical protein
LANAFVAPISPFVFSCAARKIPERLTVIAPENLSGEIRIGAYRTDGYQCPNAGAALSPAQRLQTLIRRVVREKTTADVGFLVSMHHRRGSSRSPRAKNSEC